MSEGRNFEKHETPPQPKVDFKSALERGEIIKDKELKGYWGIRDIEIEDCGPAFFRPDSSSDFIFEAKDMETRRSDLELLASQIDGVLEFGLVPTVVLRTINNQRGSVQRFIENTEIAQMHKNWPDIVKAEELTKAAVFDHLLDVKDRRGDNFLVDPEKGKIWLIDHDYFMFWNEILRSDILQKAQALDLNNITEEIQLALERFLIRVDSLMVGAKPEVIEILKKAQDRAGILLKEGQLPTNNI